MGCFFWESLKKELELGREMVKFVREEEVHCGIKGVWEGVLHSCSYEGAPEFLHALRFVLRKLWEDPFGYFVALGKVKVIWFFAFTKSVKKGLMSSVFINRVKKDTRFFIFTTIVKKDSRFYAFTRRTKRDSRFSFYIKGWKRIRGFQSSPEG